MVFGAGWYAKVMSKKFVLRTKNHCPDKQRRGKLWCGETLCVMPAGWFYGNPVQQTHGRLTTLAQLKLAMRFF
jgi:hypothetical protein